MPWMPNIDTEITKSYNNIIALKDLNTNQESITIDYKSLDNNTMGLMRSKISSTIDILKKDYKLCMTEDTEKYLDFLFRENMGDNITIEYNKINNDDMKRRLRYSIQSVFIERAREIYLSMTLNHTVS
jgi:RecB family endonuclease NucS